MGTEAGRKPALGGMTALRCASMANLTQAWNRAEAMKPLEWRIMGVVCGPRELDPVIRSENWVAWARGPNGAREQGSGSTPIEALLDLSNKLERLREEPNG